MIGCLFLVRAAMSQDITLREMEALYLEVIPRVEAAAGRSLLNPPQLVISDQETYTRRYIEDLTDEVELKEPSEAEAAWLREQLNNTGSILPAGLLAVFNPWDDRIHLLEDNIEVAVRSPFISEAWRVPLVECTLAHELVHALQHEAGIFGDEQLYARSTMQSQLIEGHAEWVVSTICSPEVRGFLDLVNGSPWIWERQTERSGMSYVVAEQYLQERAATSEEAWAILRDPPDANLDAIVLPREEDMRLVARQADVVARAFESSLTYQGQRYPGEVINILGMLGGDGYARAGALRSGRAWAIPYSTYGDAAAGSLMNVTVAVLRFESDEDVEALMADTEARWGGSRSKRTGIFTFRYDRDRHDSSAWSSGVKETYYWIRDGQHLVSVCVDRAPLSKGFVKRTLLGALER